MSAASEVSIYPHSEPPPPAKLRLTRVRITHPTSVQRTVNHEILLVVRCSAHCRFTARMEITKRLAKRLGVPAQLGGWRGDLPAKRNSRVHLWMNYPASLVVQRSGLRRIHYKLQLYAVRPR